MTCENYTQILVSLSIINFTGTQPRTFVSMIAVAIFTLQVEQLLMAAKPKYLLCGPGQKMFIYTCIMHQKRTGFQRSLLFSGVISRSYFAYKNSIRERLV